LHLYASSATVDRVTSLGSPAITIRQACADDEAAIVRLAALDSAAVPHAPLILAEIEGELRVAVSVEDLRVIADPFHRTLELVDLVRDHVDRTLRPHGSAKATWPRLPRRRRSSTRSMQALPNATASSGTRSSAA
jgi:hypothetical protein